MPPSTRRRGQPEPPQHFIDPGPDTDDITHGELPEEELMEEGDGEEEDEDDGLINAPVPDHPLVLPPGCKEISSLASWTVSTSKPGCGIPQLLAPSTSLFWQSDGPQPHHLNIHFFKLVAISGIKIYLDFDADESYTPTKIAFLAGTGYNDLVEWCVMAFEQPRGWIDVDFSGVGDAEGGGGGGSSSDLSSDDDGDDMNGGEGGMRDEEAKLERKRRRQPLLRCMLLQVQIRENHQNGKDTHLRGLQIFAPDRSADQRVAGEPMRAPPVVSKRQSEGVKGKGRERRKWSGREPLWAGVPGIR
ncbi:hypothetical protein LTS18_011907 [Coniosporium uncinatum]|uniref:Uncharacterized protein n=1 Tax=Coniosporium uncinatum TaxID=93489 RepID=A0ACC3DCY6_9PEZI|nr:hypothetical protein LTS18_011907 [Coniosporium uncinatum]